MPTVARILQLAPTACRLSADYVAKRQGLFGGTIDPNNPIRIYMVYKILKHVYDKDPSYEGLQARCNYLYELMKRWALAAIPIVDGGSGGSVAPVTPVTTDVFPFVITSSDFESDGVSYNNPDIVGVNVMIFINEWSQQWLLAPTSFVYTSTGIQIVLSGFDANSFDYTIVIQKRNNG